ncbi:hypothetical protein TNCV_735821 [Trichonephila clavipes]|uniref:Uncharacterized protein n=1 Tax=Trichonephila clavipes TaxID=2585209 RepID=A0A8X6SRV4_TRICX|nr:hypothetical protein TNCV_735821 [Trichonephila clavipes]
MHRIFMAALTGQTTCNLIPADIHVRRYPLKNNLKLLFPVLRHCPSPYGGPGHLAPYTPPRVRGPIPKLGPVPATIGASESASPERPRHKSQSFSREDDGFDNLHQGCPTHSPWFACGPPVRSSKTPHSSKGSMSRNSSKTTELYPSWL